MRYGRIGIEVIGCQYTYHYEDVKMTNKCITEPDQSIHEVEQRQEEWHELNTVRPYHHALDTI